ncbi:MAG: histidinol-phosphatase [Treponema sp.]|nr:histidinol-phosphatase [Treponema sp.]
MKTNYHTHTTFCDGKNTPKEMVEEALKKGFSILGFSSHSLYPHAADWHMPAKEHKNYFETIRSLAKEYSGKIKIYAGLEADYIPTFACDFKWAYKEFSPDYIIGSVHYLTGKKGFFTVDGPFTEVSEGLERVYGGDGKKAVCEYFDRQRQMMASQKIMILGHADLIRIRNERLKFFDEGASWYKKELKATAKAAAQAGVIVEINTGGIARGNLDDVYPSAEFLELFYKAGVPVTFSSDAHNAAALDAAFDRAELAAVRAGYTEAAFLEDGQVKFFQLDGSLKR